METDNKEKLTLKELVGYMPYELKIKRGERILKMNTAQGSSVHWIGISAVLKWFNSDMLSKPIPILRPLSDLTKEITHNGETFVPIVEICRLSETVNNVLRLGFKSYIVGFDYENSMSEKLRFCYHVLTKHFGLLNLEDDSYESILHQHDMFQKLYEWHFDIHGLIERGLAIDKNTLPNE